jgi:VanZ family protein
VPVVLWLAVVAANSGATASQSHVDSVILRVVASIVPGAATNLRLHAALEAGLHGLRKPAHLVQYGILGLLLLRALTLTTTWERRRRSVTALGIAALVGAFDELHQAQVLGRTGAARDVLIDALGAAAAIGAVALLARPKTPTRR